MKVSFGEDINRFDSGKHKFLHRLADALKSTGVSVVDGESDIFLHIGRNLDKAKAKKIVMRVDGLWFNKEQNWQKQNKSIKKYMAKSDAIVYQGIFCKRAYTDFFGSDFIEQKKHACICNGAHPGEFLQEKKERDIFFTCGNWRPHKRLDVIVNYFLHAKKKLNLQHRLVVAGNGDSIKRDSNSSITYHGWLNQQSISDYLSRSIAFLHLAWLDWCPNAVVESLCSHTPVLASKSAGMPELVKESGILLDDKDWNGKSRRLYKPPLLSEEQFVSAIQSLIESPIIVDRPDLHINKIAKDYLDFFESVLRD